MNININDILKYVTDSSKMSEEDLLNNIEVMKRNEIIQNHPHSIWQGKNGRWYTHITDETKPDGRRKIAKSTIEAIHKIIIANHKNVKMKNITEP